MFDRYCAKMDMKASCSEASAEAHVAVVEDTFAELQGWSPVTVTMSKMLVRANLTVYKI